MPMPTTMKSRTGKYCSSMLGKPDPRAPSALAIGGLARCSCSLRPSCCGADGETRTHTAYATAPSRQRVYQFHHVGVLSSAYFGTSPAFESDLPAGSAGALCGAAGAVLCGTSPALLSAAGAGAVCAGSSRFISSFGAPRVLA